MNATDIFCLPSINEGCPNVILEALGCGTSIIATNVGGIGELINQKNIGILVPPKKGKSLANAISNLLNLESFKRTYTFDISKYSWEESALKIKEIIEN